MADIREKAGKRGKQLLQLIGQHMTTGTIDSPIRTSSFIVIISILHVFFTFKDPVK